MNDPGHILIVDDDPEICALLKEFLGRQGFGITAVGDGTALREILGKADIDLVVLDLMLPGEDGLSLCRHLRETTRLPVIMLTAMGDETDRVAGLEMGADDYLAKPFSARELLARIKAVLRRTADRVESGTQSAAETHKGTSHGILTFAGWALDTGRRQLRSPDDVLVEITGGEFDLLMAFLRHPRRILNRDQLLDFARGRVAGPFDRTIDVHVGRLRRKLEVDPKNPELIKTVRGGGYVLTAGVSAK
ncbi:MAG: response regulator [Rhodospirillales bacterium]|nr:response regulator [Rhodospirillales bacterium]